MKYLLMYNPKSGKGKFYKKIPLIKKAFLDRGFVIEIYESKCPHDLESEVVRVGSNYDCIIAAGGDGTINEVVNGLMLITPRPILGVIPTGTANDVAAIFGIKKNVNQALNIIFDNTPIKMDVNALNDRYFLYTTAAGVFTKISYDVSRKKLRRLGYLAYLHEGSKELFKNYNLQMQVTHDQGVVSGNFMLALGLSSRRLGGLTLKRFSDAKLNDGKLELRLFKHKKAFKLLKLAAFVLRRGKKSRNEVNLSSNFYEIDTDNNTAWNTDGEKAVLGRVSIKVLNEALEVYISEKSKKEYF